MAYSVIIKKSAQKQISAIPIVYLPAIEKAILSLGKIPRPIGCKKLTVSNNIYRIKISVYRVVYEIHDKILTVFIFDVDLRKQVYR